MSSMNALRAVLTVGAAIAAVVGVIINNWAVVAWMVVAVAAHGAMFWYQHRQGTLHTAAPKHPHTPQV